MTQIRYFTLLLIVLCGCERSSPTLELALRKGTVVQKTAAEYVSSWADMGMYLPDEKQVAVFRNDFANTSLLLRNSLADKNSSVQMRSALVIGQVGSKAKELGAELLARLQVDPDELVRIYLINALVGIGYDTEPTITSLTKIYDSLNDQNVPQRFGGSYSEVDQKINVASAIFALSKPAGQSEYYNFVTKWLDQPSADVTGPFLEGYWERRWMAVISLEQMPLATEAIAKLEQLQKETNAKRWVSVHVPRVISYLRKNAQ